MHFTSFDDDPASVYLPVTVLGRFGLLTADLEGVSKVLHVSEGDEHAGLYRAQEYLMYWEAQSNIIRVSVMSIEPARPGKCEIRRGSLPGLQPEEAAKVLHASLQGCLSLRLEMAARVPGLVKIRVVPSPGCGDRLPQRCRRIATRIQPRR